MTYRLMYLLGITPWDQLLPDELTSLIEGPDALPAGRALDVGCGLGTKSIYMAGHGWQVTGVEAVPRALKAARRQAAAAGVSVDFRLGDVTRLEELHLQPGFTLVFDFGCFHGMKADQRDAYAQGVTAIAAGGARLLMLAFTRALPPVPAGVSEAELRERFGAGWQLKWSHVHLGPGTSAMTRAAATWFCLVRRQDPAR